MSGACLPSEKSFARSYNYSFRPLAKNIGIFTFPCSTVVEQQDSSPSTLTSAKPAWSKIVLTREISKPSHLSACSFRRNSKSCCRLLHLQMHRVTEFSRHFQS